MRVKSTYQKRANEKLTPDETRVLVRGLVEEITAPAIIAARWAFVCGIVAVLLASVALIVAVVR
jgi:hypothetical protein